MARAVAPFGLVPIRRRGGGDYNVRPYYMDASDTSAAFIGDAVVIEAGSNAAEVKVAGDGPFPAGTLTNAKVASSIGAGVQIGGAIVGFGAETRDSLPYRAASTERVVYVCDDPDAIFKVQADAAFAAADIGKESNLVAGSGGSTATGISSVQVDATAAASSTGQVKVLGLHRQEDNVINTAGNVVEVIISLHQLGTFASPITDS